MDCLIVRANLALAHYGEMDAATARAHREHLQACPGCAGEALALRRLLLACTPAVVFPREAEVDWDVPLTCWAVRRDLSGMLEDGVEETRRGEIMAHLGRCPGCATESAAISATLARMRNAFPEETRVDWDAFARRTVDLAMEQAPAAGSPAALRPAPFWRSTLRQALPLAASLAAAAVLVSIFLLPRGGTEPAGLTASQPVVPATPGLATAPDAAGSGPTVISPLQVRRTEVALARADAARYLSDSRSVLLSFASQPMPCDGTNVDISVERDESERLLRRKQYLERSLKDVEIARAGRLANEIESLLTEIASLENCTSPEHLREITEQVHQRQLMMRIEILTTELGLPGGSRA